MDVSVVEAKKKLSALIKAVENGESVIITRNGKPVAQLTSPPPTGRVQFERMRNRIKLYPGWDDPMDLDEFLRGNR